MQTVNSAWKIFYKSEARSEGFISKRALLMSATNVELSVNYVNFITLVL